MARQTDSFRVAWDALAAQEPAEGWRSISVEPAGPCPLLAARRFPGNEEALLVGFGHHSTSTLRSQKLPDAYGFEVMARDGKDDGRVWLSISRKPTGNSSLFAEMISDIVDSMDVQGARSGQEDQILRCMLVRIRAWQDFMRKDTHLLSLESELGLMGELFVLHALIEAGTNIGILAKAWVGSLDYPQDFFLGYGAIEVKTTVASSGFRAHVGSLEQLDELVRSPLFMAAVRLDISPRGTRLGQLIDRIEGRLSEDPEAKREFSDRVLSAGYKKTDADKYTRQFVVAAISYIPVHGEFPRLTTGSVPNGVRDAAYDVDVQPWTATAVCVADLLKALGVD